MKCTNRFHPHIISLLAELVYCWQSKTTELLRTETAIMIVKKHCEKLKHYLFREPFYSDEEEIFFFRYVQSHFTGRLCYYTILYEALVSCPVQVDQQKCYWENEQERYSRFRQKNKAYIQYLESGCSKEDAKYFLSRYHRQPQLLQSVMYSLDPTLCTELGHIASMLFAENLYHHFASQKLAQL